MGIRYFEIDTSSLKVNVCQGGFVKYQSLPTREIIPPYDQMFNLMCGEEAYREKRLLRLLEKYRLDINHVYEDYHTLFTFAVATSNLDSVKTLLEVGAKYNYSRTMEMIDDSVKNIESLSYRVNKHWYDEIPTKKEIRRLITLDMKKQKLGWIRKIFRKLFAVNSIKRG